MTKVLAGAIAIKNGVDVRAVMAIFKLKAHAPAVREIASWLEKHRKMNETRLEAAFERCGVRPK